MTDSPVPRQHGEKVALGLRTRFPYRKDRIRAQVQRRWLALLHMRVVENATADVWQNIRRGFARSRSKDGQ